MNIKQVSIDNGAIGGIIATFTGSMFVYGIITFINTTIVAYNTSYHNYVSPTIFFGGGIFLFILYEYVYFTRIIPSLQKFCNKQAYVHENPIKNDIFELKEQMNRIEKKLSEKYKNE